jgi:ELWxxDGT repeat protein
MTVYSGKLYFSADDRVSGLEIWVYDSSTNTALRVTDINPTGDSDPRDLTVFFAPAIHYSLSRAPN